MREGGREGGKLLKLALDSGRRGTGGTAGTGPIIVRVHS